MAIIPNHHFHPEHGFTGSASPMAEHRPKIPCYKYGGNVHEEHDGKHSKRHLKDGAFVHGAKDHYKKGGHIDHDGESNTHETHYDEHGFQHMKHGGKAHHSEHHGEHHGKHHGKHHGHKG